MKKFWIPRAAENWDRDFRRRFLLIAGSAVPATRLIVPRRIDPIWQGAIARPYSCQPQLWISKDEIFLEAERYLVNSKVSSSSLASNNCNCPFGYESCHGLRACGKTEWISENDWGGKWDRMHTESIWSLDIDAWGHIRCHSARNTWGEKGDREFQRICPRQLFLCQCIQVRTRCPKKIESWWMDKNYSTGRIAHREFQATDACQTSIVRLAA